MSTRPKAVLFTDMEGSTAFISARGDEDAVALKRVHEDAVRTAAGQHDGWVVKNTGDGFLVVFPTSTDGVACAFDIRHGLEKHNAAHPDSPLRVRMGLHTGPVIEENEDVFGLTVTASARVTSKAASGQLFVSDAVRADAAGADWTFVDRGLFWLKGLREQWRLYEATSGEAVAPPAIGAGLPFVGRDAERATLRRCIDEASAGHGGLVFVAGVAGSGKTRFVEEVGAEAQANGLQFVIGRCDDTSQTDPYAPLIEVMESVERHSSPLAFREALGDAAGEMALLLPHLRQRFSDVPAPTEAPVQEQRRYLFMSVRDVLARIAAVRPLVILLDDLHWADGPTLMFLEHLAPELAALPVAVVGTYRVEAATVRTTLHASLARLHQRHLVDTIEVPALTAQDVDQVLTRVGGAAPPKSLVRALYESTEGNAFFLSEVTQQLLEQETLFDQNGWKPDLDIFDFEVPESVRFTIENRLQALQPSTQRMLVAASPMGREFEFEFLAALSDLSEDDLVDAVDEAERARLIASTVDAGRVRFSFAHELVRQTLLSQQSYTRRQRLHLHVADALERIHAAVLPEYATSIAYHLREAGPFAESDRIVTYLRIAGERALQAAAFEEAVRHLGLVLSMVDEGDSAGRAPVLEHVARAQRSLGNLDEALALWNAALEAYEAVGDAARFARVCLDAAIQVAWWTRGRDVTLFVERGLAALGDEDNSTRAGLLAVAGMSASQAGPYERGEELFKEALAGAMRHKDDRIIGLTLYTRATHHFVYQEYRESLEFGMESVEYLRRVSDFWSLASVLGYVGGSYGWLGRFDEAAKFGAEGEELANRLGNWSAFVFAEQASGFRDIGARPGAAPLERRGRQALELGRDMGMPWLLSVGHARVGLAEFWRGRWPEALRQFEESARLGGPAATGGHLGRALLVHAYLGNGAMAKELMDRARPEFPVAGRPITTRSWGLAATAVEALQMLGEREETAAMYDTMSALAASGNVMRSWDFRLVATLEGMAAACRDDWDTAEAHFEDALQLAQDLPMRREDPEARRFFAQMLLDRGRPKDRERARELCEQAAAAYKSFRMPRHASLTRSLL